MFWDLSRVLAGPQAAQMLGELGAEVIKVERPGRGDDSRLYGEPFLRDSEGRITNNNSFFMCANRNKRSVAVDLANPEGRPPASKRRSVGFCASRQRMA